VVRPRRGISVWFASAGLSLALQGCAHVHAYERGRLANHAMSPDYAASPSIEHVQTIHEGAAGGTLQVTSGCGCN
jgi:hypothetical protein